MKDKKLLAILATKSNKERLISEGYTVSRLISAGYTVSELISEGYTVSRLISEGYTVSELISEGYLNDIEGWDRIPKLEKPYSKLWEEIQAKKRLHNQSDWGPSTCPTHDNICKTPMCTAGHLVNMAGSIGYELQQKYGWAGAASLIHAKSCPDLPEQNYGAIKQEWALAFIECNAELESKK